MSSDPIDLFAGAARAYCQFVQTASTLALPARIAMAQLHLLDVYRAGLSLPTADGGDVEASPSEEPPPSWPGFGDNDRYWKVVGPYARSEPVAGSISDDMLLIYRYLQRGLALWDGAHKTAAAAEWRRHFEAHWSDHAIDATRALHRTGDGLVRPPASAGAPRMTSSSPSPPPPPQIKRHLDDAQLEGLRAALSALGRTVNDGLIALQAGRQLPAGAFAPTTIDPSKSLDVRLKEFLQLIHSRMKLIREGDPMYGTCVKCREPIEYRELEFEPWLPRHAGCWKEDE